MQRTSDALVAELAVSERFLTKEELEACVQAQALAGGRPLLEILVEMQLVTGDQVSRLQEMVRRHSDSNSNGAAPGSGSSSDLFGRLAIESGYVTAAQVEECLAEQAGLDGSGQEMRLGQIMVRRRYLTPQQFVEVLRRQKRMEKGREPAAPPQAFPPASPNGPKSLGAQTDPTVRRATLHDEIRGTTSRSTSVGGPPSWKSNHAAAGTFGRYKLLAKIAKGRVATVYKALDVPLNRLVALKMVRSADSPDPETVSRFLRQAKAAARLNHPGIITIHEVGTQDDATYFTMEFVEGPTLARLFQDRTLDRRRATEIVEKAARALDYAHSCRVIHGNLSPGNVLVDRQNQPHLTDFGMSPPAEQIEAGGGIWLAPEVLEGAEPDASSDVYSLGVLLYTGLTGERPFAATDGDALRDQVRSDPPRPSDLDPTIPAALEEICLKAMHRDAAARYGSAIEMADDLRRHLKGEAAAARTVPFTSRVAAAVSRRKFPILLVLLVAVAAVGLGWWYRGWAQEQRRLRDEQAAKERRRKAAPLYDAARQAVDRLYREIRTGAPAELRAAAEAALGRVKETLDTDPAHGEAAALRVRLLGLVGRLPDMEEELERALCAAPGDPALLFERGRVRWRQHLILNGSPLAVAGPAGELMYFPARRPGAARRLRDESLASFKEFLAKVEGRPGDPLRGIGDLDARLQDREARLYARAAVAFAEGRPEDAYDHAADLQRAAGDLRDEAAMLRSLAAGAMESRAEDSLQEFDQAFRHRPALFADPTLAAITPFSRSELEWAAAQLGQEEAPDPSVRVARGLLSQVLGRPADARRDFEAAAKAGLVDALERLCFLDIAEGRTADAASRVDAMAVAGADPLRVLLARTAVEDRRVEDLQAEPARLSELAEEAHRKLARHPMALLLAGRARLAKKNADAAHRVAAEALRLLPSYYHAFELKAAAKVALKDKYGAAEDLKRCRDLRKDYLPAYRTACALQIEDRRFDLCRQEADEGLKQAPDDVVLLVHKARALGEMQELRGAEETYRKVLSLRPQHAEAMLYHGLILVRLGRPDEGWPVLDRLVREYPDHLQAYLARAQIHRERQEFEKARAEYEKALAVAPDSYKQQVRAQIAELARQMGPEWLQLMQRALTLIGRSTDHALYPKIHELYLEAFRHLKANPPKETLNAEVRNLVMLSYYNHACTWSVLSKDAGDEKANFEKAAFEYLEKALAMGFDRHGSGACQWENKAHTGLEHTRHDADFEPIRERAEFKAILEKYSRSLSKEEF